MTEQEMDLLAELQTRYLVEHAVSPRVARALAVVRHAVAAASGRRKAHERKLDERHRRHIESERESTFHGEEPEDEGAERGAGSLPPAE